MKILTKQLATAVAPALLATALVVATAPVTAHAQSGSDAQAQGGERRGGPDFDAAAEKLGISADDLRAALGGPPPDFQGAAATLGITEEALKAAMGGPPPRQ